MSDVTNYSKRRAAKDPEFAEGLDSGYADFKIGVLLRHAREEAGLTQQQVAQRLETNKSAISRIETRAGDIRLSTLERYARALGCQVAVELRPRSANARTLAIGPEPELRTRSSGSAGHRPIKRSTLSHILKQARLTVAELERLL